MCTILHSLHNLNSHSSAFIDTAVPKCVALTHFPPLCDSDGQVVMRKVSSCVLLSYMCLHFAVLQAFVLKQHRHNILESFGISCTYSSHPLMYTTDVEHRAF